jgi:hypothetical protein
MDMISKLKTFVLASVLATATLAASSLAAPQLYAGSDAEFVVVAFDDSEAATVTVDAAALLDARDLIRVDYETVRLDALLRVKQVIAPEGISVTLEDSSLAVDEFVRTLNLEFEITNDDHTVGSFPVTVILENAQTGKTTTVNFVVIAQ